MPNAKDFEGRVTAPATLTIQKGGLILLNRAAYVAFGRPRAVELLYDRAVCVVGLRAVNPRASHGYPVRSVSRGNGGPFVVSALAFTRFYDIDISRSRRWAVTIGDGVLSVDLSETPILSAHSQGRAMLSELRSS